MNRILNLQAIVPSIDLPGVGPANSQTSISCTSGCTSSQIVMPVDAEHPTFF